MKTRPNIFEFNDPQVYFREMVDHFKELGKFSNRSFARELGLKSHSLVPMIYYGQRSISHELAARLVILFELNEKESEFFQMLVERDRSRHPRHRLRLDKEIEDSRATSLQSVDVHYRQTPVD